MWEGILPLSEKLIWTPMFHNVKIVGNRNIPLCLAEFKDLSASNAMVHINLKTIVNLVGVPKPMKRLTHLTSKQKKSELCLYIFKCSNCHGDHQVDSNLCLFWKHRFNQEWYNKKYIEIHENKTKSTCLVVNRISQWFMTF